MKEVSRKSFVVNTKKKACGCSVVEGKLSDQTSKARICKVRLVISQRVIEL